MKIQYYPLIYTASRGLDYNLWISPPNVCQTAVEICRRSMADDLYGVSNNPKRLYVKTPDFLLWGVCMNNRFMTALDPYYYTDAFGRPIRGFYGAYIPLPLANDAHYPQSLPLDFDDGLPFTQNMLFQPFVQSYWTVNSSSELNRIAPIQNLILDDEQLSQTETDFSLSVPQPGFYRGLASRSDESLNRIIQRLFLSKQNVGIVTGVESQTQARDLAKLFNIQFIERTTLSEDSDIEIEPKPKPEQKPEPRPEEEEDDDEFDDENIPGKYEPSISWGSGNKSRSRRPFRKNPFGSKASQQEKSDNSSGRRFTYDDNSDENADSTDNLFDCIIRIIMKIFRPIWKTSPNRSDNVQNKPKDQDNPSQPDTQREQTSIFRQRVRQPENSTPVKKPFVQGRKIISETHKFLSFDNLPSSPNSETDSNGQDLNNPTQPHDNNDSNDSL